MTREKRTRNDKKKKQSIPSPLPSPRQSLWRGEDKGEGRDFRGKALELCSLNNLISVRLFLI